MSARRVPMLLKSSWRTIKNSLPVVLPFILFLAHAWFFRDWIIDDAGISFVYARNLAHGNGLVSQPGMAPVEGYSNFTWVLLMVPFFLLGIFDPIVIPKLISLILVLISFITVQKTLKLVSKFAGLAAFFALAFLALNTSFVVWTTSGLENPLYILLISLLLWQTIQLRDGGTYELKRVMLISGLSALCGLTRPDGIVYFGVFPFFVCLDLLSGKYRAREAVRFLLAYTAVFILIYGSYIAFRYFYFGDLLPNTYYAKGRSPFSLDELNGKIRDLFTSVGLTIVPAVALLVMFIYTGVKKSITPPYQSVILMLAIAALAFFLLPFDWMGEYRFATPFLLLFYLFVFLTGERVYHISGRKLAAGVLLGILAVIFTGTSIASFYSRSKTFAGCPTVPFTLVAENYGFRFNQYASEIGIENGSYLGPDMGGTLYYSELKIYDLVGLTDKTIAKSFANDEKLFFDYVFDTLKPTFIHTHDVWTYGANFDADPRFRRDYAAIDEIEDPWVLRYTGQTMYTGDYIRKDAIANQDAFLEIQSTSQPFSGWCPP
jgi:hypothetical protein